MLHAPHIAYADLTNATPDDIAALDAPQEDLTVQASLDGITWHRKAVGGDYTACGLRIEWGRQLSRYETYRGAICTDGCFSRYELALSIDATREAEEEAEREAERTDRKWREWRQQAEKRRIELDAQRGNTKKPEGEHDG